MTVSVIIEHDHRSIHSTSLRVLTAARQLSDKVQAIVLGYHCETVVEQVAKIVGVTEVVYGDDAAYAHFIAENMAATVVAALDMPDYLLVAATTFGKNLLPRIAAKWTLPQVSDVIEIINQRCFKHPIYGGNALETLQVNDAATLCLSIRATAFAAALQTQTPVTVTKITKIYCDSRIQVKQLELHDTQRPRLSEAKIIFAGGRGLKNQQNFATMVRIADKLGAGVAASRAAVDAGLAPNDWQVGQTGQSVAPALYFALGISGATQHLAGMKDSGIIVAINRDPDAPIFQVADYGLVADLETVLPQWESLLQPVEN